MTVPPSFPIRYSRPPPAPEPVTPVRSLQLVLEMGAAWQWARLVQRAPALRRRAAEHAVVVLIPGWKSPESMMTPLRRYLRWRGHDARHWGLGWNEGKVERDVRALLPEVQRLAHRSGRPVALVGWSLGGVIAREIARERPDVVQQVISYGTPVVGGPTYTIGAHTWGPQACERMAALTAAREASKPIPVPITAIFSRNDRIVAWPACIDRTNPHVSHVEVGSSHTGMGIDPDVWAVIAEALERAQPSST